MNDRTRVVTMAQELAEALPEQMSRLGRAEDLLKDLIAWHGKNEAYRQREPRRLAPELTKDFEDIVERAKQLIEGRGERGSGDDFHV